MQHARGTAGRIFSDTIHHVTPMLPWMCMTCVQANRLKLIILIRPCCNFPKKRHRIKNPIIIYHLPIESKQNIETCWWTPNLGSSEVVHLNFTKILITWNYEMPRAWFHMKITWFYVIFILCFREFNKIKLWNYAITQLGEEALVAKMNAWNCDKTKQVHRPFWQNNNTMSQPQCMSDR